MDALPRCFLNFEGIRSRDGKLSAALDDVPSRNPCGGLGPEAVIGMQRAQRCSEEIQAEDPAEQEEGGKNFIFIG